MYTICILYSMHTYIIVYHGKTFQRIQDSVTELREKWTEMLGRRGKWSALHRQRCIIYIYIPGHSKKRWEKKNSAISRQYESIWQYCQVFFGGNQFDRLIDNGGFTWLPCRGIGGILWRLKTSLTVGTLKLACFLHRFECFLFFEFKFYKHTWAAGGMFR